MNKEQYRQLCETEGDAIPLFLQYWWMETVCHGKQWDVLFAHTSQPDGPMAVMPYLIGKRLGMRYILQPQLTQYNGPWLLHADNLPDAQRTLLEHQLYGQLIDQLHDLKLAYYQQNFAPSVTNWLPYYWKNFSQTTRYTYRLEDISNPDAVFALFHKDKRQKPILKAQLQLHAVEDISPESFTEFHQQYWHSRGQHDIIPSNLMLRVMQTAQQRGQALLLGLRDSENHLQAARFVVFDSHCAYSLFSALNPQSHLNGASPLLFWEILQRLSGRTRSFDFEGSMDPGIEQSYRLYGATQTPYFQVSKCNNPLFRLLLYLRKQ